MFCKIFPASLQPCLFVVLFSRGLRSLNTVLKEISKILPIDKIFCVLLIVHLLVTFIIYKMPQISGHGDSKIAREPFLEYVCFVFMSAARTHETSTKIKFGRKCSLWRCFIFHN